MGASSCAQDDGLQPRHRVRQPFMSIADGRCRGYKSRSMDAKRTCINCAPKSYVGESE